MSSKGRLPQSPGVVRAKECPRVSRYSPFPSPGDLATSPAAEDEKDAPLPHAEDMKRLLTFSFLAVMLAPASVALAASPPAAARTTFSHPQSDVRNDIAGGAVGSVVGVVAISTFSENCTGAVIAPKVVLTAAHCLDAVLDKGTIRVRLAHTHRNLGVSDFYRAPGFDPTTHDDDAAVLILKSPVKVPALPVVRVEPRAGTGAMITGYGQQTYTSAVTTVAYSAATTIQSFASCQATWAGFGAAVPSSDMCAMNAPYYDSTVTRGDSGGPLLVKSQAGQWSVAGINDLVLIPNDVYDGAIPQAFARVNTMRPWIESEIARFG
jgi:secreted trypsin-like serine protease